MRNTRYEISTVGLDPALQAIGADPDGSGYQMGIHVPTAPSTTTSGRYLFMLAKARFGANVKARLVGIRQLATIITQVSSGGEVPCIYPLELEIKSPFWHFTDGNISWHLRRVPLGKRQYANASNAEGQQVNDAQTPALIYSSMGPPYVAPKVPGTPLIGALGTFYHLGWSWREDHAYDSLDWEFQGPCDIALYCSVKQTNPETRCPLILPGSLPAGFTGLPDEDAFVVNFSNSIYGRVAGSLVFEENRPYPYPDEENPLVNRPRIRGPKWERGK